MSTVHDNSGPRTGASVVVQTHWDREWYLPHQAFIARLLHVMAEVADQLESGQLHSFLFDGQTAALEDLLANCEPALAQRVLRLVEARRIVLGPWYVMADEFLSSGEALLRNLELGMADAGALGSCQRVGYLPDTFGHVSQMPQILRQFGIGSAVMWRGVDTPHSEFDWVAPDGSVAGTVFLTQGYYQHPFNVPDWQLALTGYLDQVAPRSLGGRLLLTQGGDHLVSSAGLANQIAAYNADQQKYALRQESLADYVGSVLAASAGKRSAVAGELRQNAQAFVLPDVLSTRRYLKHLNQQAEDRLAGALEPLYAQLLLRGAYPAAYIEQCWRTLIQQQAHDSICGCSTDEVHEEMRGRYLLLNQRFDALLERASAGAGLISLAAHDGHASGPFADDSRFTLFNPLPQAFDGWQEHALFIKGDTPGGLRIAGPDGAAVEYIVLDVQPHQVLRSPLDDFPDMLRGHLYRVALRCAMPGLSALACTATPGGRPDGSDSSPSTAIANTTHRLDFANGRLTWTDNATGRAVQDPLTFMHELDAGDSYNFSPPAGQQATLQRNFSLDGVRILAGMQEMTLSVSMQVPAALNADRSGPASGTVTNSGTLRLRLWDGSDTVDCQLDWHNAAQDQRTRLLLPLPEGVTSTGSDSAFSWEVRPVVLADYPAAPSRREMPVCVMPSQSAIAAGDLSFAHRAMQEYEIVDIDGARHLAVTMVRSVGWLSRRDLVTRGVGAGPDIATPGAQCIGRERFEFNFGHLEAKRGQAEQALARTRALRRPPLMLRGHCDQWRESFDIGNTALQVSVLRRVGNSIELRVWNPCGDAQPLAPGMAAWSRVLADGSPAEGGLTVAPHAIATFRRPA